MANRFPNRWEIDENRFKTKGWRIKEAFAAISKASGNRLRELTVTLRRKGLWNSCSQVLLRAREVLLEFHVDISNSSTLCVTRTAGTAFVILLDTLACYVGSKYLIHTGGEEFLKLWIALCAVWVKWSSGRSNWWCIFHTPIIHTVGHDLDLLGALESRENGVFFFFRLKPWAVSAYAG